MDIQDDLNLLSKFFYEKEEYRGDDNYQLYQNLFAFLEENFVNILRGATEYGKRFDKVRTLDNIMERLLFYLKHPEVLGKSTMITAVFDSSIYRDNMRNILHDENLSFFGKLYTIPTFFIPNVSLVEFENNAEKKINLNKNDISYLIKNFGKKIDIAELLSLCLIGYQSTVKNLVIANIVPNAILYRLKSQKFYDFADYVLVYGLPKNERDAKALERIKSVCFRNGIELYLISDDAIFKVHDRYIQYDMKISHDELIKKLDVGRKNYLFADYFKELIYEVFIAYKQALNEYRRIDKQICADLTVIEDANTQCAIKEIRSIAKKKALIDENMINDLNRIRNDIYDKSIELENILKELTAVPDGSLAQNQLISVWEHLLLMAYDNDDIDMLQQGIDFLKKNRYYLADSCQALLFKLRNQSFNPQIVDCLKDVKDNNFVRHLKMRFIHELSLAQEDYMYIARDLDCAMTPIESYYKGKWECANGNYKKAKQFYIASLQYGLVEAKEELLKLVSMGEIDEDDRLNLLVPEWNYKIADKCIKKKQYFKGDILMKVSASQNNLDAIYHLVHGLYNRVMRNYYKNISEDDLKKKINNCINLYRYLIEQNVDKTACYESLGYLYNKLNDPQRAIEFWEKAGTGEALYRCGKLYQYKTGILPQNKSRAAKYFKQSLELGYIKSESNLKMVTARKKKRPKPDDYKAESYTTEHSGGGGCFITTAACLELGKGDDCKELTDMRHFRDTMKSLYPDVGVLIDEYYIIAPKIINEIEHSNQEKKEYSILWRKNLKKCHEYILNGDYKAATLEYIDMVEKLSVKYDVAFSKGIAEIIASVRCSFS